MTPEQRDRVREAVIWRIGGPDLERLGGIEVDARNIDEYADEIVEAVEGALR